jgi:hypothetical protein
MPDRRHAPLAAGAGAWAELWVRWWEVAVTVPLLVAQRSARITMAGPNPRERDRRETARMGQEKAEAYWEAFTGMTTATVKANLEMAHLWAGAGKETCAIQFTPQWRRRDSERRARGRQRWSLDSAAPRVPTTPIHKGGGPVEDLVGLPWGHADAVGPHGAATPPTPPPPAPDRSHARWWP